MSSRPMLRSVSLSGRRKLQNKLQSKVNCVSRLQLEESYNILHKIRSQCFEGERKREISFLNKVRSQYSEERIKEKRAEMISDRQSPDRTLYVK
jgi:hypothetical protein